MFGAFAQSVDLSRGKGSGITLEGNTLISNGGSYYLPEQSYANIKGIKLELTNFVKLDESAGGDLCKLNVIYINADGQEKKASMSFWVAGRKDIRFSEFKDGKEIIQIDPASIKNIALGMGADKKLNVSLELIPDKK